MEPALGNHQLQPHVRAIRAAGYAPDGGVQRTRFRHHSDRRVIEQRNITVRVFDRRKELIHSDDQL